MRIMAAAQMASLPAATADNERARPTKMEFVPILFPNSSSANHWPLKSWRFQESTQGGDRTLDQLVNSQLLYR
jgi:hypothetical protein